jgi:hypothetical protein
MLNLIAGTRTKTGLQVDARLNDKEYVKGIQISAHQMKAINLKRNDILSAWNYVISPN